MSEQDDSPLTGTGERRERNKSRQRKKEDERAGDTHHRMGLGSRREQVKIVKERK